MGKANKMKQGISGLATKEEMRRAELAIASANDHANRKDVSIDDILLNEKNDYSNDDTQESIEKLAKSIEQTNGPMHNLVVSEHPDRSYVLISGERRLRALRLLRDRELGKGPDGDPVKWQYTNCLIMQNLTARQEMIFLDAANLQVRGGISDEKQVRTGTMRYIGNLQEEYGISREAAIALVEKISAQKPATIEKSIQIEERFPQNILDRINDKRLPKRDANILLSVSDEDIERLSEIIGKLEAAGAAEAEIGDLIQSIVSSVSIENKKEKRSYIDAAFQKAEKLAEKPQPTVRRERKSPREAYLDRCEAISRQLNHFASTKTIKKIVQFDNAAESREETIITSLTGLRDRLNSFIEEYNRANESMGESVHSPRDQSAELSE